METHDPMYSPSKSITMLLADVHAGRAETWDKIYELLYREIHTLARSKLWRSRYHTLTPTALINETWLKLSSATIKAENRNQLIALMAATMRSVLLDEAKRKLTEKRGGDTQTFSLSDGWDHGEESQLEQLVAIDTALNDLKKVMPRMARVVELRYFGGLQEQEIATVLEVTVRTVRRDWSAARVFLMKKIEGPDFKRIGI